MSDTPKADRGLASAVQNAERDRRENELRDRVLGVARAPVHALDDAGYFIRIGHWPGAPPDVPRIMIVVARDGEALASPTLTARDARAIAETLLRLAKEIEGGA